MDFFCLKPIGIRAAYGYPALVRKLRRGERRKLLNRIVLLLTADRRYALHGMRPGTRLRRGGKGPHLWRRIRIGRNDWYIAPNGASRGVLKVRHGVIEEVGIAERRLTRNPKAAEAFLRTLI